MTTEKANGRLRRLAEAVGLIDTSPRAPMSVRRFLWVLAILVPTCTAAILMFELMGLSGIAGGVGAAVAVTVVHLTRVWVDGSHRN